MSDSEGTRHSSQLVEMLRLARPELPRMALGMVCLAIGSAMGLAFPQVIRLLVDDALGQGKSVAKVNLVAVGLLGLFLVQAVAAGLRTALFGIAGERTVARLRARLFTRLLDQEIGFFDQRESGELMSRLASDAALLQSSVSVHISTGLGLVASVLGGVGFMIYTSPRVTLLMLAVVPAVAFNAAATGRRLRKLSREIQDAVAASNEVAAETLTGIRTVRAFAAEASEAARYGRAVDQAFQLARRRSITTSVFIGVMSFSGYAAAALLLWYGGYLVVEGALTVGALTSFLVYTMLVAFSLGGLGDLWTELTKAAGAAERVFEILHRTPGITPSGGHEPAEVAGRIDLEGVHFSYPARKMAAVLQGVDLAVQPGEVVALVGPSGAGKSTIAALLLRLYDPDAGRILLDGRDVRELDPGWLRRQIGLVSQEPTLFSCSIADNIRYGRMGATDEEVTAAAKAANAHDFIMKFPRGYATRVGERGTQLSGGQKQRVAIARALLKDPRILVLDEATSALDAESEHLVQEALDRLMQGRTTLIIAHRLSTVVGSDRVIVLEGGRVIQSGDHAALVREDGLYRRLVERQFVFA